MAMTAQDTHSQHGCIMPVPGLGTGTSAGDSVEAGTSSENKSGNKDDKGGDWGGKKGKRGRNKKRPKDDRPAQADTLCHNLSEGRPCTYGERCGCRVMCRVSCFF